MEKLLCNKFVWLLIITIISFILGIFIPEKGFFITSAPDVYSKTIAGFVLLMFSLPVLFILLIAIGMLFGEGMNNLKRLDDANRDLEND